MSEMGPMQEDTQAVRDIWLEGYRWALANLDQPGVLADAHRYKCENETSEICPHIVTHVAAPVDI